MTTTLLKITCSTMAPPHLSECQHGNGAQSRNHACTAPGGISSPKTNHPDIVVPADSLGTNEAIHSDD